ncbi:MAG: hypothetical protein Q9Q40_07825 [Acidobacteriota bacterium]|nr:hypothetical protein [Acidobacteriota bacterium]
MNSPRAPRRHSMLLLAVLVALGALSPGAATEPTPVDRLAEIQREAIAAYNDRQWRQAAGAADRYVEALDGFGLPHAGSDYALVAFIGGHARFEVWKADPPSFSYDFQRDVLGAMQESLHILQDDPFFKHNVLATACYEKLKSENFRNLELENLANWHFLKALISRRDTLRTVPRDDEPFLAFEKYLLLYISRAFEMARESTAPEIYLVRVREACRMGLGGRFTDRFAQLYRVVGFDRGNVRAGVLWQSGLDLMNTDGADPEEVLGLFSEAAAETRGLPERAEIYRQMSDFASRQDGYDYRLRAVEYARQAFKLDPAEPEIQVQYGTSLHVLAYAHYNSGRFGESLELAREAIAFQWEGDEVAYFDLSRAEANFGMKLEALRHAQQAYEQALRKLGGDEVQPYRQNYANILRQFGMGRQATIVEHDTGKGGRP